MAAITQRGKDPDGEWRTCYSIIMRPAPPQIAHIHDRVPLLLPSSLQSDWLTADGSRGLIDEALIAAASLDERIAAVARADDKGGDGMLF
ncbi:SOS response-associated peptidase [Microbacterium sp. KUDC0406]|uniref:SOS response-associated peptidase family protein n=1 Tax=Microbacterium sp. KUDC0406 TaxID=2909588 RepID=UPI001F46E82D|nr:SOS response-associated peptidase family protein [Microbacterium sp. KUDC0406]UJP10443.1 SOS response-associated peptidase [Microbacterium sp. KUDC0406]